MAKFLKQLCHKYGKNKEIAADALMPFPNHNIPFHTPDHQINATIIHQTQPNAYWSQQLSKNQQNYNIMEMELLSIIKVFEEFYSLFLGTNLFIYTDHKNFNFSNLNCWPCLHLHLFVEESDPTILYHLDNKVVFENTSLLLSCHEDLFPILEEKNAPVFLFDFTYF